MAEFVWTERAPLEHHIAKTERQPAAIGIEDVRDFSVTLVAARAGTTAAAVRKLKAMLGVAPPALPGVAEGRAAILVWHGPDQWLIVGRDAAFDRFASALSGIASVSDQSDSRILLRLSGPRVREALAKLISIDLDDSAFPAGAAAVTSMEHIASTIWRTADRDGAPVFFWLLSGTFAESLWETIAEASAGPGFDARVGELSI